MMRKFDVSWPHALLPRAAQLQFVHEGEKGILLKVMLEATVNGVGVMKIQIQVRVLLYDRVAMQS